VTRGLHELRRVEQADVYKQRRKAATLRRGPDSIVFAYEADYAASGSPPVAMTLPVTGEPVRTHAPGALPPFFSGLLPEGRRLAALRNAVKTSADDEMSLLLAVGSDTIGDVQVVPEGEEPVEAEPLLSVTSWDEVRFHALFSASVGGSAGPDRVALPGVQDKVSARMMMVPVAKGAGRFILKLDPPEFPHLVANEAFFLQAARLSGLDAAEAKVVHDAEGVPGLLVRRFDRVAERGGERRMLAVEDGCQVLGRYPADKYRFTTEEVITALAAVCRSRPVAALTLLKQEELLRPTSPERGMARGTCVRSAEYLPVRRYHHGPSGERARPGGYRKGRPFRAR
jgi:serine/threonine-protein kinase HipA